MLYTFEELVELEEKRLKSYAVSSSRSKGRAFDEKKSHGAKNSPRLPFQKDRDRIMHCRAFRRLSGKTQVFVTHHGDHFRTRLTHSLEVAQISRDLARNMGLNEDLAETIGLAHDLGHTPFGHAGQDTLDELMKDHGFSFEHNEQSRRIVQKLENIYPEFRGLNLSQEVIEGLMKHKTSWDNQDKEISVFPSLEAQVVNLADEIAYNNHDVDDGLRAGLISLDGLSELELWARALTRTRLQHGDNLEQRHLIARTISNMISLMIEDVLKNSSKLLSENGVKTLEDVYNCSTPLVSFSPEMLKLNANLKSYLAQKFYFSPEVLALSSQGQGTIKKLFDHYLANPKEFQKKAGEDLITEDPLPIQIKDYIAGMTDNFAEEELKRAS